MRQDNLDVPSPEETARDDAAERQEQSVEEKLEIQRLQDYDSSLADDERENTYE